MGYWNVSVGVIRAIPNHSANYSMSNERRAAESMSMVVQGGLVVMWTRSGGCSVQCAGNEVTCLSRCRHACIQV